MRTITIGLSDYAVSDDPEAVLITYALGSCIAVMLHDPVRKLAGMIHYMLPLSTTAPEKAVERPAMFADTGIPLLFSEMYKLGTKKEDLVVKVAGGASSQRDGTDVFNIGKRNYTVLRKMFWKAGVVITAEEVGGTNARTASLFVGTGRVTLRSGGEETELCSAPA